MSTYMQVLTFSIIIPLIFSFHNKIQFYKRWSAFIRANILATIPFLIWDELFTRNGIWGFNNEHIIGVYLFNLPIEEILFFTVIPYCCVFTYEVFLKLSLQNNKISQLLTLGLGIIILLLTLII